MVKEKGGRLSLQKHRKLCIMDAVILLYTFTLNSLHALDYSGRLSLNFKLGSIDIKYTDQLIQNET